MGSTERWQFTDALGGATHDSASPRGVPSAPGAGKRWPLSMCRQCLRGLAAGLLGPRVAGAQPAHGASDPIKVAVSDFRADVLVSLFRRD